MAHLGSGGVRSVALVDFAVYVYILSTEWYLSSDTIKAIYKSMIGWVKSLGMAKKRRIRIEESVWRSRNQREAWRGTDRRQVILRPVAYDCGYML